MSTHRVAVIGGDGIGPEVVADALNVVRAAGVALDAVDYDLGGARYLRTGEVLPDAVLEELRGYDAILLGAVGTPDVPPGVLERGLLLRMRFELDLYVNLRPFRSGRTGTTTASTSSSSARTPRAPTPARAGSCARARRTRSRRRARSNTRMGVERCVRFAFELARVARRQAPHARAQDQRADVRRRPVAADLRRGCAAEYPDVATAYNHVDAACIYFVEDPGRYDVIVTDNLFGDILTDLGGAIAGGIGRAASANLNPARTGPSLFEPVHGSAPDIAGQRQGRSRVPRSSRPR